MTRYEEKRFGKIEFREFCDKIMVKYNVIKVQEGERGRKKKNGERRPNFCKPAQAQREESASKAGDRVRSLIRKTSWRRE